LHIATAVYWLVYADRTVRAHTSAPSSSPAAANAILIASHRDRRLRAAVVLLLVCIARLLIAAYRHLSFFGAPLAAAA